MQQDLLMVVVVVEETPLMNPILLSIIWQKLISLLCQLIIKLSVCVELDSSACIIEEYEKAQQEQSRENALNEVAANVRSVRNYIDKFTEEDPETEFNSIVEEKSLLTGSDIGEFSLLNQLDSKLQVGLSDS